MSEAFVYLSFRPQRTARRLERYFLSLKAHIPSIDIHVITFDRQGQAGATLEQFRSVQALHTTYNVQSLATLGYPNKVSPDYRNFQDGFVDLPVILFSNEHPHYDLIWVAEDDVAFTGEFGALIKHLNATNSDAGLACTHVRLLPEEWDYAHLFSSGLDWLPPQIQQRLCFLPFFGVTRRAIVTIHDAYHRGWSGHNEMLWATILDFSGIPIRDIGGAGPFVQTQDLGQHYIDKSPLPKDFRKLGSFGTMNIRLFPGRRANMLWHPVKTSKNFVRMRISRGKSIFNWFRKELESKLRGST